MLNRNFLRDDVILKIFTIQEFYYSGKCLLFFTGWYVMKLHLAEKRLLHRDKNY